MKTKLLKLSGLLALCASVALCPARAETVYKLLKEIPVGGAGGWDYLSVDAKAHRLYVSHATKVVVIDLEKDAVAGEVADTSGVHGFAVAPELGRGFSSNGRDNSASIVDLKTWKTLSKVTTGANPDAILYEPSKKEVYTFNGRGKSATVFEAESGKVLATIALPGKPEFAASDAKAGRVFCNIEDTNQVVAIDTATHAVVATWAIAPGEEATGMDIDRKRHLLFLGCGNQKLVALDYATGKVVGETPAGDGVDAAAFDPGTGLVFASAGEGSVTIARADAAGKLTPVQTLATVKGARTMALDPETHKIYLGAASYEAAAPAAEPARPKAVAGSFRILVYGP